MHHFRSAATVCAALVTLAGCQDIVTPRVTDSSRDPAAPSAEDLRVGYILHPDGTPRKINYEVRGGVAIIEGDIAVGLAENIPATPEQAQWLASQDVSDGPNLGAAITSSAGRWPNGKVPYRIDASVNNPQMVRDAMAHIEYWTARVWNGGSGSVYIGPRIDFVPVNGQTNYINITETGGGCYSYVGLIRSGAQTVSLDPLCLNLGTVIHELTHALGLAHEHTREDRDNFVWVYSDNVIPGKESNFFRNTEAKGYSLVAEYDEQSVMHYDEYTFSANNRPTLGSKRGVNLGKLNYIRWNDIYSVQWMYGYNYGKTAAKSTPHILRAGPSHETAQVGTIAGSTVFKIVCQTRGTTRTGPWGSTDVWNKLPNGMWFTDAFTYTGTTRKFVSDRC